MNFNMTNKRDYALQSNLTNEMINLYGILIKFVKATKINKDDTVFGDFSHLKTTSDTYNIYALPENSEEWSDININFSGFGLTNTENINLFVSRKSIDTLYEDIDSSRGFDHIIGNLIILPNNKIMEITSIQFEVPGVNNLYANNDVKNVYKLTCVTYNQKLVQELASTDISPAPQAGVDYVEYSKLDDYFEEMLSNTKILEDTAKVKVQEDIGKPVLDTTEDSVFGRF